ncbi:MAG: hypothetical protein Wins2KO_18370 [Winogradskyella sp.]
MKSKITMLLALLVFGYSYSQNIALGKTTNASSEENAGTSSANAVDGNLGSRWSSAATDTEWWSVDLGATYTISQVIIEWEGAYANGYTIDISSDNINWTTIYTETAGDGGTDNLSSLSGTGRYIRYNGTSRATPYGHSFWEFEVYGTLDTSTDASLNDLQIDGVTISGFSSGIVDYTYEVPIGTTIVPQITTATATQAGNGSSAVSITQASAIGSDATVLVTAPNGTNTLTYTVSIIEAVPTEPSTAPTTPPHAADNVISVYSDTYTDLSGTNFNPGWGQATTVTVDYDAGGNNVLRYENLNYQGTQYANQDVSEYEYLHVDFWTSNSTDLGIYLISPGNETEHTFTITSAQWVSVDIPLTDFVPPVDLTNVFQFKVEGNGTIFLDNLYFWKAPSNDINYTSNTTITNDASYDTVTIDSGVTLTIAANGSLTASNTIVNDGTILMQSSSSEFSALISPSISGSGALQYQRYTASTSTNDLITAPFSGETFSNLLANNAGVIYTNPSDATEYLFGPFNNNSGVYVQYDSDTDGSITLNSATGYRSGTNSGAPITFTGTFNNSNVQKAIAVGTDMTYGKWNLIGNPFPSYLDLAHFFTDNLNELDTNFAAIYAYNGEVSKWTLYDNNNSGGVTIAPGQAFYVAASGTSVTELQNYTFDDNSSLTSWSAIGDATNGSEASLSFNATGNGTGAIQISGVNSVDNAGRAYIFEMSDASFNYQGISDITVSFDVKYDGTYSNASLHNQIRVPKLGGGEDVVNTFDIQNQGINSSTWTNIEVDITGLDPAGTTLVVQFNIAAGAFNGAGGTVLIDNIVIAPEASSVASGNINFDTDMQTVSGADDFITSMSSDNPISHVNLFLNNDDSTLETDIFINELTTTGLDVGYDTGTFANTTSDFSLYTKIADNSINTNLAHQAFNLNQDTVIVPLGVHASQGMNLNIGINNSTNLGGVNVYLRDKEANIWTLLNNQDYTFTAATDLSGSERFELHFSNTTLSIDDQDLLEFIVTTTPTSLIVNGELKNNDTISIVDLQGKLVYQHKVDENKTSLEIYTNNISQGIYVVTISDKQKQQSIKVLVGTKN